VVVRLIEHQRLSEIFELESVPLWVGGYQEAGKITSSAQFSNLTDASPVYAAIDPDDDPTPDNCRG